jgi:pimeloyl-ACP methyl ester carboxylesterase
MNPLPDAPQARFYQSHGLRLHYTDWGNASAPPLLLVHGGSITRSWDHVAQALQASFHHRARFARSRRFGMGKGAATAWPITSTIWPAW